MGLNADAGFISRVRILTLWAIVLCRLFELIEPVRGVTVVIRRSEVA